MPDGKPNLFVLTGGPGSGKTSVIEALRLDNHNCADEAGRHIIRQQVATGGDALPWSDRLSYAEAMLRRDLESYHRHNKGNDPAFFDRGIPDIVGYLRLEGLPVPEAMMQTAKDLRYANTVFLFPPWPEIFTQDEERKQTPAVAEKTHRAMAAIYGELGYNLIEVPKAPVEDRKAFILAAAAGLC